MGSNPRVINPAGAGCSPSLLPEGSTAGEVGVSRLVLGGRPRRFGAGAFASANEGGGIVRLGSSVSIGGRGGPDVLRRVRARLCGKGEEDGIRRLVQSSPPRSFSLTVTLLPVPVCPRSRVRVSASTCLASLGTCQLAKPFERASASLSSTACAAVGGTGRPRLAASTSRAVARSLRSDEARAYGPDAGHAAAGGLQVSISDCHLAQRFMTRGRQARTAGVRGR